MKNEINLEDFKNYSFRQQIAGSFGKGLNKSIDAVVSIGVTESKVTFQVIKDRTLIEEVDCFHMAVNIYNVI